MQIQKNFFLICENVIMDDKKRVSLINLYDFIIAPQLPAYHGRLFFAINITVSGANQKENKLAMKLLIKSPSGQDIIKNPPVQIREVRPIQESQKVGIIFGVDGVVFNEYGNYIAIVYINDKEEASLNIQVIKGNNKQNARPN